MKFILSQELSRHNRDKKCSPVQQPINYKTYQISYETIEILPSYTIITPSETVSAQGTNMDTSASGSSEILVIQPISHENQNDFGIQELTDQQNINAEDIGTIKSWNCGLCSFK